MNYLTIKEVAARANKDQSVIWRQLWRFDTIRLGNQWGIADNEKLQGYIDNPPKRGARKK
jgi:hypothetical protein